MLVYIASSYSHLSKHRVSYSVTS